MDTAAWGDNPCVKPLGHRDDGTLCHRVTISPSALLVSQPQFSLPHPHLTFQVPVILSWLLTSTGLRGATMGAEPTPPPRLDPSPKGQLLLALCAG